MKHSWLFSKARDNISKTEDYFNNGWHFTLHIHLGIHNEVGEYAYHISTDLHVSTSITKLEKKCTTIQNQYSLYQQFSTVPFRDKKGPNLLLRLLNSPTSTWESHDECKTLILNHYLLHAYWAVSTLPQLPRYLMISPFLLLHCNTLINQDDKL